MPITALVNPGSIVVNSTGNALPVFLLDAGHPIPNAIMTGVTPDYTDSSDGAGDTFDASIYALSFFETVEGMLVTIPDMVVADGFVTTSGGRPIFQAYSTVHADADQINSRGGYTIAGDPPIGRRTRPRPATTRSMAAATSTTATSIRTSSSSISPASRSPRRRELTQNASMGDGLGDVTGIIDFDFTDRKLFVTNIDAGLDHQRVPVQETTALGNDSRALTVATFNVENLDPGDGAARFAALAGAIANNLNSPDIITIEEMQDNNGAAAGDGISRHRHRRFDQLADAGRRAQSRDRAPIISGSTRRRSTTPRAASRAAISASASSTIPTGSNSAISPPTRPSPSAGSLPTGSATAFATPAT